MDALAPSAGSPLFLRELVRHGSTVGTLESLPTSLVALLETGLSHLSDSAQRTLQVAAVLGTHATVERVEHIARNFHQDFINTIWELEAAGVLVTDAAGAMYGHVLWAEAALSHLSPGFRRMLHRHAAESFDGEMALRPTTAASVGVLRDTGRPPAIPPKRARRFSAAPSSWSTVGSPQKRPKRTVER